MTGQTTPQATAHEMSAVCVCVCVCVLGDIEGGRGVGKGETGSKGGRREGEHLKSVPKWITLIVSAGVSHKLVLTTSSQIRVVHEE